MATSLEKVQCSICNRMIRPLICGGCSQSFCRNDLIKHLQTFGEQLDQIENNHDQFRQTFLDQKNYLEKCLGIKIINQWENDSIEKIKQMADEYRQTLTNYTNKYMNELEIEFNILAIEIKEIRQENEFNEIDLNRFKTKLNKLEEELRKLSDISIEQEPIVFINKIHIIIPHDTSLNTKWKQTGLTVAGGNDYGTKLNQLSRPQNIFIDDDQTLCIADWENHRIIEWKTNAKHGQLVVGGKGTGNETNQLSHPTDVIIDKENDCFIIADHGNKRIMRWSRQSNNGQILIWNISCWGLSMGKDGSLYVSDYERHEVRRWKRGEKDGTLVAGGNGKGNNLNQLNIPTYIFVDENDSLYISDQNNNRVMKWLKDAQEGIVVAGGNGWGLHLTQLSHPQGVIVDHLGQIYVADFLNHRVTRWREGEKEGTIVVGGNEVGEQSNQLRNPRGLSFDRQGNLYVVDCGNHRIQKFIIDKK